MQPYFSLTPVSWNPHGRPLRVVSCPPWGLPCLERPSAAALYAGQGSGFEIVRAMQRHRRAFAVFAVLMVAAFCTDQNPTRLLQSGDDLFAVHWKYI